MPEYFQNAIGTALGIRPSPTWPMSGKVQVRLAVREQDHCGQPVICPLAPPLPRTHCLTLH